jgi:hypothetical protein
VSTKFVQINALGVKIGPNPGVIDFPYLYIVKTLKKSSFKKTKKARAYILSMKVSTKFVQIKDLG